MSIKCRFNKGKVVLYRFELGNRWIKVVTSSYTRFFTERQTQTRDNCYFFFNKGHQFLFLQQETTVTFSSTRDNSFCFLKNLYCTLFSCPYIWYCLRNLVVPSEIRVSQYFLRGTCITNCASSQKQRYRRGEGSRRTMSHSSSLPPVERDLASLPLTSETHPVKSCIKVLTPSPLTLTGESSMETAFFVGRNGNCVMFPVFRGLKCC